MKIDSPTFVSETQFISASVVYSSGSQKFGNTEDDQHTFVGSITASGNIELTGANKKISGSRTSTGSFGSVHTAGNVGIGITSPDSPLHVYEASGDTTLHLQSVSGGDPTLKFTSGNNRYGLLDFVDGSTSARIRYDHSAVKFEIYAHNQTNPDMSISETLVEFGATANQKISGSSTSTGSFGQGFIANKLGIGTASPSSKLHVHRSEAITENASQRLGYISLTKTGGDADESTSLEAFKVESVHNDASSGFGNLIGMTVAATNTANATADSRGDNIIGMNVETTHTAGRVNTLSGNYQWVNVDAGTIDQYVNGIYTQMDIESAANITGNVTGHYIHIDNDDTNAANTFGIEIDPQSTLTAGIHVKGGGMAISGSSTSTGSFGQLHLGGGNSAANPTLNFGDGNTGIYESEDNQMRFAANGSDVFRLDAGGIFGGSAGHPYMIKEVGSSTNPVFTFTNDTDTGLGGNASNELYLITAGGAKATFGNSNNYAIDVNTGADNGLIVKQSSTVLHQTSATFIDFPKANFKISGSSSSTGSFGKLHIKESSTVASRFANDIVINEVGETTAGMSILTSTSGVGRIYFGDTDNQTRAYILYDHSSDILKLSAASGNKLTLDDTEAFFEKANYKISGSATSTGSFGSAHIADKVGIGTTAPTAMLQIQPPSGTGDTEGLRLLNDTHQVYMSLYRGGSERGRISTSHSDLTLQSMTGGGVRIMDDGSNVGVYVKDGGNVGIGTTLAPEKLTVEGNISGSGTLTLGKYSAGSHVIIKTSADEKGISIQNTANASALRSLEMHINAAGKGVIRKTSAGGSDNDLYIQPDYGDVYFPGAGNVIVAGNVSGSSTSTGSFGVLKLAKYNQAYGTSDLNTFYGILAGGASTISTRNVAIGNSALAAEDVGDRSTAVGYYSLYTQNSDSDNEIAGNTGLGYAVGYYNETGQYNTFVGYQSAFGASGQSNSYNTAVGVKSLYRITTGQFNQAFGYQSGEDLTSGGHNALYGADSGAGLTTASQSVFIGSQAGTTPTTGNANIAIGYGSMQGGVTTGDNNIAIGKDAGDALTSGRYNIFMGKDAGGAITTVGDTIAIGHFALDAAVTSGDNVALGNYAMTAANGSCTGNTSLGHQSMTNLTTGDYNISVGMNAGMDITTGDKNIAIGYNTTNGGGGATGNENTFVGNAAAYYITSASGSVFVGANAGFTVTTGNRNIAIGWGAINGATTTGDNNIAIGVSAGDALTSGYANTLMGKDAGGALNSGARSVLIGHEAGASITTGYLNVVVGYQAADALLTGTSNTIIGARGLGAADGAEKNNVVVGTDAMGSVNNDQTEGNIALGTDSMVGGTGGLLDNIAIGRNALNSTAGNNVTGSIAIGYNTLTAVTSGILNVAIGYIAGDAINTGQQNVALGYEALSAATTVTGATALGAGALGDGNVTGDASYTTAVGLAALKAMTTGAGNVAVGAFTGDSITTGAYNTIVGYQALTSAGTGVDNNTAVGYRAGYKLGDDGGSDHSDNNTMMGQLAMGGGHDTVANNTANHNVAIGSQALGGATGTGTAITGTNNTAVGVGSMKVFSTGYNNVSIGKDTGDSITTGVFNTLVGTGADVSVANGENQTAIGYATTAVGNNSVTLGNSSVTDVYMSQDKDATVHSGKINAFYSASSQSPQMVYGSGSLGTSGSAYPAVDGIKMSPVHFTGYQEVTSGTGIIISEVFYVSGTGDSRMAGTLEVNYTAEEDNNRSGYYLFRIGYTGNTNITTVHSSVQNSSAAAVKVNAGSAQAIKVTPTTTGSQNVLIYYEFKGFIVPGS